MITNQNNKKISDISAREILPLHKNHTWLPAAQFNSQKNSYHNIAINLQAITDYSMSYSAYLNTYTMSYINERINSMKRDVQIIPVDYNTIFSYITSYSSDLVSYYMDNVNKNMAKLIKDAISAGNKTNNKNSYQNTSYNNIAINLQDISDYFMSYSSYLNTYTMSYVNEKINSIKRDVQIIPVDYNTIFSYITSYSSNLVSYYMDNMNKNVAKLIKDAIEVGTKTNNSINRNNSKKISEITPRSIITQHKDHSWFVVAQYDSRTNSYVNLAMNLATITGYCNEYAEDKISYALNDIHEEFNDLIELQDYSRFGYVENSYIGNNIISYSFAYTKEYIDWQYIQDNIEDLLINHKLVNINSEEYTPEALSYIQQLVDSEGSILFDSYTNRIYTLGKYYGGDTLKEDLKFYTKILNIDLDDNEISYISAEGPESELAFQGKNSIIINTRKSDGKDIIEIGNDLNKMINVHSIYRKDGSILRLFINKDGKVDIDEYRTPKISLEMDPLEYDAIDTDEYISEIVTIIDSSIPYEQWEEFEVTTDNCELLEISKDLKIKVKLLKGETGVINIQYNDGFTNDIISFDVDWADFLYYGIYDGDYTYDVIGKYPLGEVENKFIIDQGFYDYGFIMLPIGYDIIILDDLASLQGSWYKKKRTEIRNNHEYTVWVTTNEGMGKVRWKIIKNI